MALDPPYALNQNVYTVFYIQLTLQGRGGQQTIYHTEIFDLVLIVKKQVIKINKTGYVKNILRSASIYIFQKL